MMRPMAVANMRAAARLVGARHFSSSLRRSNDAALLDQIKAGLKDAMRAKDSQTSTVLRSILSEQQYAAKQSGGTPATLSSLLQKAVARRREAATQFRQGQRDDLAEKEEEEAVILERFLPRQMSVEEVEAVAKQALAELGDVDGKKKLGALIKAVNARVDRSAAPGAIVSKACANVLA